jgi:sulfatase modifying factor 1
VIAPGLDSGTSGGTSGSGTGHASGSAMAGRDAAGSPDADAGPGEPGEAGSTGAAAGSSGASGSTGGLCEAGSGSATFYPNSSTAATAQQQVCPSTGCQQGVACVPGTGCETYGAAGCGFGCTCTRSGHYDCSNDCPPPRSVGTDSTLPDAAAQPGADASDGSDAGLDATSDSGVDVTVCTPGTQQCADEGHVETCGPNAQWGDVWACAAGTCAGGACAGSTTAATSCPAAGGLGLDDCGPGGSGTESCCTSLEVPGGTYNRTYSNSGGGPTAEADPATVSGFRLDKYLVTVGRFRQFVTAWNGGAGYLPPPASGKHAHLNGGNGLYATGGGYETGWVAADDGNVAPTNANLGGLDSTWTDTVGTTSQENLPINSINWWEAYAFCTWDGGFLPSEAEWEYAAAAGSQELEYPWGDAGPGSASQYAIYDCDYGGAAGVCTGLANIAPVGTAALGVGFWGQLDLAGEVFEWNLDDYASPYVGPCTDCVDITEAWFRVIRGGRSSDVAYFLLPPSRVTASPDARAVDVGFRCARTP